MSLMDTRYALAPSILFVFMFSGKVCSHIVEIGITQGLLESLEVTFKP
jgi:hypothetical protein